LELRREVCFELVLESVDEFSLFPEDWLREKVFLSFSRKAIVLRRGIGCYHESESAFQKACDDNRVGYEDIASYFWGLGLKRTLFGVGRIPEQVAEEVR